MAVRISGLVSGLDTDSIVQELVSAYSKKKEKYEKAQTKQEWKMDSWKTMNSKIYGFYTSSLANMKMSSAYNLKTSSVSNSSVAKVTASSSAVNGTHSLKVKQLASSAYLTGGVVKQSDGSKVSGDTALSKIGIEEGSSITVNNQEIKVTSDMTVNKFIAKLNSAGVTASFDENNQRFFVSASKSGSEGEFTMTANNFGGLNAIQSLGLFATKDTQGNATSDMKKYQEIYDAGDDGSEKYAVAAAVVQNASKSSSYTSAQIDGFKAIVKAYDEKSSLVKKYESNKNIYDAYVKNQEILQKYSEKVDPDDENSKTKLDVIRETLVKEKTTDADGNEVEVWYSDEEFADMQKFIDAVDAGEISKDDSSVADKYDEYTKILAAKSENDAFTAAADYTNKNHADFQSAKAYLDVTTEDTYNEAKAYIEDQNEIDKYNEAKSAIAANSVASYDGNVARITGQDSIIELNGATFTSSSGTYSINGLSITAMQVTGNDAVSITTSTDTKGIYDKIKGFITKYNELIKDMDTAYNAASASDYEPLTDDEKEEMTDKEIEKWETKIKDSLLRRDSTLGNTSSSMKSIMSMSFEINGKTYSLQSFGIATGGYFTSDTNERGCLHIDGDADDSTTSGNADKLMAAINEDPDTVTQFFQKLSSQLYSDLTKRMASSSVSSIYTIYNDKQMSSEYSEYKDMVSKWEDKLDYYEEFYYKKFSAMESALSKLQSSTSSLSNLLGS